jgi:hypothetical protein
MAAGQTIREVANKAGRLLETAKSRVVRSEAGSDHGKKPARRRGGDTKKGSKA